MDQDATWYGGRPCPRPHCVRWNPAPPQKRAQQPPPIFGPCLLWPNGWMDQDATWCRRRPRPRQYCVRWGPSSPQGKGHSTPPTFWLTLLWHCRPSQLLLSTCFMFLQVRHRCPFQDNGGSSLRETRFRHRNIRV